MSIEFGRQGDPREKVEGRQGGWRGCGRSCEEAKLGQKSEVRESKWWYERKRTK